MEISLVNKNYKGKNVGYIIEENLSAIEQKGYKRILLRIASPVIYGTFTVPGALGFSTPIDSLQPNAGAHLIIDDDNSDDSLAAYKEWSEIFSTTVVHK